MIDYEREEKLFLERIETGFYAVDRARNSGNDYVDSGKLNRDTEAVAAFVNSNDFHIIRKLR